MPVSAEFKVPEADKDKVMHVSLPIGKSILMGSDVGGVWPPHWSRLSDSGPST